MTDVILLIGATPIVLRDLLLAAAAVALLLLIILVAVALRSGRARTEEAMRAAERQRETDDRIAELNRLQAEVTGRLQSMAEHFGSRQADLVRIVADRMDAVRSSLGQGLQQQTEKTTENLSRLNERLAVIDAAQKNLSDLTGEVLVLKDILANKQSRGAFGQGRMEAIVRDGLPPGAYEFQVTLSNRNRPDCIIRLPGDERPLVIDAKFPLEAFKALEEARSDDAMLLVAERQVRNDLARHIGDVAQRYLIPGETQDLGFLFIPSESLYATIADRFEDVIQKAHRARIVIVSPSLLMMAIQVMRTLVRDAKMRDQAHVIQKEVGHLLDDVRRLGERVGKLDDHFRQAQKDVSEITISVEKVVKRATRIESLEFEDTPTPMALPRAAE